MVDTLKYYNENVDDFIKDTLNADVSILYECFEKYLNIGAAILDLGCGSGRDSKYFIGKGYKVTAIDGSFELCKKASQYIGQKVECKLFNQINYEDEFDGIWACSSLLHVPRVELREVFQKLHLALEKNGCIYVSFKFGDFSGERNGRFFTDMTEEQLRELLSSIRGLEIKECNITGDVREGRSDERWLNAVLEKIM